MSHIISVISNSTVKAIIPQVVKLCKLYLINPATTATPERSFSVLRRMKTYLRSTISQERLNSLLILYLYSEKLDAINMKVLVNEFINSGDTKRQNAFATFNL